MISYAKNYFAVQFKLDYVNANGDIANYFPDFLVRMGRDRVYVVETKGPEDVDVPLKMHRLRQWCADVNRVQSETQFDFVYVDQESFEDYWPRWFSELVGGFTEFK